MHRPPLPHRKYFIILLLHGLGRLTCSGTDALPSFPGASTFSSSSRFVVEGVFRESVISSLKVADPILFVFGSYILYSRNLQFFSCDFASFFLSSLVYPLTLLRQSISAASRRDMSRFVVTHVSLSQINISATHLISNPGPQSGRKDLVNKKFE